MGDGIEKSTRTRQAGRPVSFEFLDCCAVPPPQAASLLDAWQAIHAQTTPDGGPRPTRADFTPFALKPWLGHIDIFEVERTPDSGGDSGGSAEGGGTVTDFRLRLNGTEIVALTGEDWTGHSARDIDRYYNVTLHDDLLAVCESGAPHNDGIRIFQKSYLSACRLLLPVFSNSGDGRVTQIFLAIFATA